MALFGKKKRTLEEILEDVSALSPEELSALRERLGEAESGNGSEPAADNGGEADTPPDDNGADGSPTEPDTDGSPAPTDNSDTDTPPEAEPGTDGEAIEPEADPEPDGTEPTEEPAGETADPVAESNAAEIIQQLTERVQSLEAALAELTELKAKMDEYVNKQKDAFGYKGEGAEGRKNYEDMTADELRSHILNN